MTRCQQPTRWSRSATCSATCPTRDAITAALTAIARALRPGGLFAIDLCDLSYGQNRRDSPPLGRAREDWAVISATALPVPDRFIRQITVFMRNDDGSWRRDDERHDNVLIDTARVPGLLAGEGVEVNVTSAFGTERLPTGLAVLVGRRAP